MAKFNAFRLHRKHVRALASNFISCDAHLLLNCELHHAEITELYFALYLQFPLMSFLLFLKLVRSLIFKILRLNINERESLFALTSYGQHVVESAGGGVFCSAV